VSHLKCESSVFEATGRYRAALERYLGVAGYPFVKVKPRQAKRFGEALGHFRRSGFV